MWKRFIPDKVWDPPFVLLSVELPAHPELWRS